MKRVIIESPYAGDVDRNEIYLDRCILDCIKRDESPYASHKMVTTVLDDTDSAERVLGIRCGYAWYKGADLVIFYLDYGWSDGMLNANKEVIHRNINHDFRYIGKNTV